MSIQEVSFGPKRYLTLRKSIATSQITDKQMYSEATETLISYMKEHTITIPDEWSVLYFVWDELNRKAEIGISFPVAGVKAVSHPELYFTDVPESKAAMDTLYGSYEGLSPMHQSLMKYAAEMKYDSVGLPVLAIEEYVIHPMSDPNPSHWVTNIYYLHA